MAVAAEHAVLRAKWMVALKSLQAIPAIPTAAADKALPKKTLHFMASQAEVDCTCAELNICEGPHVDLTCKPKLQPAMLQVIIHKLQVCAEADHSNP
jgi:hypothetical protein